MTRPRLLDLFCGAGGAAVGYHRAGFDVIGVDIKPQPHYPFEFHQDDATFVLDNGAIGQWFLSKDFDAIHASPPCQDYSRALRHMATPGKHPRLIDAVRALMVDAGVPWIIENVPGAPMRADYKLCGCMFGLPGLRRERWFETSWQAYDLRPPCSHQGLAVRVNGGGGPNRDMPRRRRAMGIDWMTRAELNEAIPPAYTEYVGARLLEHLAEVAA